MDIEFGYGNTAAEITKNIISLAKLGVSGINIEDSFIKFAIIQQSVKLYVEDIGLKLYQI